MKDRNEATTQRPRFSQRLRLPSITLHGVKSPAVWGHAAYCIVVGWVPRPGVRIYGAMYKTLFTPLLMILMLDSLSAGQRDAEWNKVKDAMGRGLPQTAITNLEPILQSALNDKAFAEATKAIGLKIVLQANIQGNKPEEKINRLEQELAKAPTEMAPMLHTLLAHWYWQYFQQNRWRFLQRTATSQSPGNDFTTWDLPRIYAEIDKQFQSALAAQDFLKATPVTNWNDLLITGTVSDAYRPTLYDFISHEALSFYTSGEQAAAQPEDTQAWFADKPVFGIVPLFGTADEFTGGKIEKTESASPAEKALFVFRDLIRFHSADADPSARAAVDLERLVWANNVAAGENKNDLYQAALKTFADKWAEHEISALALNYWASLLQQTGDLAEAHRVAERGARVFPESPGGKLCRNVLNEIEAKSATIETERVWNQPWPKIEVRYCNLEMVYFRAIPYNWETFLEKRHRRPENLSPEEKREVLARQPALEWSEKLPATTDYKEKSHTSSAPQKLPAGFYFIAASHEPNFSENDNVVSFAEVWVSDLAMVTRMRAGAIEGFVLEANSGEPLAGAEISIWHLDNQGNRVADPQLKTDENGLFTLTSAQNRGHLLRARHHGQELATATELWTYLGQNSQQSRPYGQTVLFTDRGIYRPGQLIQYKGICLWVDQAKDNYEVLTGENVVVVFKDSNGKEIARQSARANDYGSFSGSFTVPRDRLMGQMQLVIEGRARGFGVVNVEEYKRPKFAVTLKAPTSPAKLNEKVTLAGHAMSYNGAAVDHAKVTYRVVRQARLPWWSSWFRGPNRFAENQEISHGTIETQIDGSFKIEFAAKPDPKVPEKDEPIFTFQIHADVTDGAGETRSADRDVRLGYTALEATLIADTWQTEAQPVELKISTRTLDDEPQTAEGSIKVYELQAPAHVQRPLLNSPALRGENSSNNDPSDPTNWPLGKMIAERGFNAGTNGLASVSIPLPTGLYRALLETTDGFGKKVTTRLALQVLRPNDARLALKIPRLLASPKWEPQPGEDFLALWGTGYETGRAFIEIEHRNQMIQRYWTTPGRTQQPIRIAVTEAMRGGFTLHVTQVRENRGYLESRHVEVPWTNKELDIKWEHFSSKLQPGQTETWTAVISPEASAREKRSDKLDSQKAPIERPIAEMVATLYDESLDAFSPLSWPERFAVFRRDTSNAQTLFGNAAEYFVQAFGNWNQSVADVQITHRSFPAELVDNFRGGFFPRPGVLYKGRMKMAPESFAFGAASTRVATLSAAPLADAASPAAIVETKGPAPAPKPASPLDLGRVTARKNLNETAFFYPQLVSDSNGAVRMTFTMPEALTKWRFQGFAHDPQLRSGYLEAHTVTAKELMVQPNPPRFLREKDVIEFTVKVSNQSDAPQTGKVRLAWNDALLDKPIDQALGNTNPEQPFDIPAKESRTYSWRISVPDGCGYLTYKAVAASDRFSDGEEGPVPVLSSRILVTESLPLPIRGPGTKRFEFTNLIQSAASKTLRNQSLSVQMVSHPAWYAVLALPYLMEFPYECSEQTFNRLYANSLASSIARSNPRIRSTFDQWKNTKALESPLEKNQDLKAVALEETPWLRQAENENQARHNLGILFDENRLGYEVEAMLRKLSESQLPDGLWPWFPGGPGNEYITLYIMTGFGRLQHLGVDINAAPALRSLTQLDAKMTEHYREIQKLGHPEEYVIRSTDALYLYGRSFFLKDIPVAAPNKIAVDFFLMQARKHWLKTGSRQTQGHLALALNRFSASGKDETPGAILKSLKERSVTTEEMGTFWRDTEESWWWYRAPIETQALMIEAFDEIGNDREMVENCRTWLLKQKQTQDWKTTKATADAVYALLLRGSELLASDSLVEVKLGGMDITPRRTQIQQPKIEDGKKPASNNNPATESEEPGTGFYERRFSAGEIQPQLGEITLTKSDAGVAWGSVNWQYLEEMSNVKSYQGTPLHLTKTLFVKSQNNRGPVLKPVQGDVEVGAELVTRIELRTDRAMEYVHLKDQRGSGTEPINVLSQYKYQDGLAYYESTRDTASHFFIDYLPKGVYVFEYSTRVQLRGNYQSGTAEIQCMYAPEFNSHSESVELRVK